MGEALGGTGGTGVVLQGRGAPHGGGERDGGAHAARVFARRGRPPGGVFPPRDVPQRAAAADGARRGRGHRYPHARHRMGWVVGVTRGTNRGHAGARCGVRRCETEGHGGERAAVCDDAHVRTRVAGTR